MVTDTRKKEEVLIKQKYQKEGGERKRDTRSK